MLIKSIFEYRRPGESLSKVLEKQTSESEQNPYFCRGTAQTGRNRSPQSKLPVLNRYSGILVSRIGLDQDLCNLALRDTAVHGLLFDIVMGLGFIHIEFTDQDPFRSVYKPYLFHFFLDRMSL